mmetsp:Transcript_59657/g.168074  ORF Transcript_59657/g.168074 Transcript_59657/m.168074 type:complete len:542 (-) Transcript_59657:208-1833(-)
MSGGPKPHEVRGGLGLDPKITSEVALTGAQAGRHWEDKCNAGYSGTPLWRLQAERAQKEDALASQPDAKKVPQGFKPAGNGAVWFFSEKQQVYWNAGDGEKYVWDAVAGAHKKLYDAKSYEVKLMVGSCFHDRAVQTKHVLVKDLAKAGQSLRLSLDHLDRPCALYALYEGHRGTKGVGNACADFCAKHMHQKLLAKLAAFRSYWEDERLEAAMRETFEELDAAFLSKHPTGVDGCCAAVALVTGGRLVVASVGNVGCVLCLRNGEAVKLLKGQTTAPDSDEDEDDDDGDEGGGPAAPGGSGAENSAIQWTRSLGDADLKRPDSSPRLLATPDVIVLRLQYKHHGFAFVCRALYAAVGKTVAVSTVFKRCAGRPRMASGALTDAAVQWLGEVGDLGLGSVVAFFDWIEDPDAPKQKRPRREQLSQVRLRHILLKHRDCRNPVDKVRGKQVKRAKGEAERILRGVLEQCQGQPDRQVFTQRCKEFSECQSCLKSGDLIGDLGWVKPGQHGQSFDEAAFALPVGQLSDLVDSDQGVHVILRTA